MADANNDWQQQQKIRMEQYRKEQLERNKKYAHWKVGDLVFVHYKNRYFGVITEIKVEETYGSMMVTTQRLYDEYGAPADRKTRTTHGPSYMDPVDKDFVKRAEKRFNRIVELFEEYSKKK